MEELLPPLRDIITDAVRKHATDIHMDRRGDSAVLRLRIDGEIGHHEAVPTKKAEKIINQIKVAADMEPVVATLPRDGQFHCRVAGADFDVRATVVLTSEHKEAAHLRILTPPFCNQDLSQLGLDDEDQAEIVKQTLRGLQGLVLIAGPTGSGKTTTAYSLLGMLASNKLVAASIEDPVEFNLPNARQVEVDEKRGLTMEEGLRTILRMDPDIVLVGEVCNRQSAEIAGRAALAGRLVLATVHARNAISAIDAMHYLSVPYYVLGAGLRLVLAQNLVRRLCPQCAEQGPPDDRTRRLFREHGLAIPAKIWYPKGCSHCGGDGYHGRIGVFEVAPVSSDVAAALSQGFGRVEIQQELTKAGAQSIVTAALKKVATGITSSAEVYSILGQRTHE